MSAPLFKKFLRNIYRLGLRLVSIEISASELARSAVIFAPHPDDETLACGGTIIRKKRAGARVLVVFMTDGSNSHHGLVAGEVLRELRAREALAACSRLGVGEMDVVFFGYEDGRLGQEQAAAVQKVEDVLVQFRPKEIYIPCSQDRTPDHVDTHRIVIAALHRTDCKPMINEYPVWFWQHWPWMEPSGKRKNGWQNLKTSIKTDIGYLLRYFRYAVDVTAVLDIKRAALEEHQSQIKRLDSNADWVTLSDVSSGEFLECLFQPREVFLRYTSDGCSR